MTQETAALIVAGKWHEIDQARLAEEVKDVVVWTPEEVEAWAEVPHAFITTALREGKTLYAQ